MLKLVIIASVMTEMIPKERILSFLYYQSLSEIKSYLGKPTTNPSSPRHLPNLPCDQINQYHHQNLNQYIDQHKYLNHFIFR